MERTVKVPSEDLGFQAPVLTFFPLPRSKPGAFFERVVNGLTCVYFSVPDNPKTGFVSPGVPYTALDRRWLEIVSTLLKRQYPETRVELGAINETLKKYGMSSTGGKRGYIGPAKKAIEKIANLHISVSGKIVDKGRGLEGVQGLNLSVGFTHKVMWGTGRTDLVVPELFDGENFIQFSKDFADLVDTAAPHIQAHYMAIRSTLTLDLYKWLVSKLANMNEDSFLMRWPWIYAQFGPGTILNEEQRKTFRGEVKRAMAEIIRDYYPRAWAKFVDEGLLLKKSPPLISKAGDQVGYSPF